MRCIYPGCKDYALFIPQIAVPLMGEPIGKIERLRATVNVPLCKAHMDIYSAATFLTVPSPDGKHTNRDAFIHLAEQEKLEPDFDRAYVRPVRIKSTEAKGFVKAVMRTFLANAKQARSADQSVSPPH